MCLCVAYVRTRMYAYYNILNARCLSEAHFYEKVLRTICKQQPKDNVTNNLVFDDALSEYTIGHHNHTQHRFFLSVKSLHANQTNIQRTEKMCSLSYTHNCMRENCLFATESRGHRVRLNAGWLGSKRHIKKRGRVRSQMLKRSLEQQHLLRPTACDRCFMLLPYACSRSAAASRDALATSLQSWLCTHSEMAEAKKEDSEKTHTHSNTHSQSKNRMFSFRVYEHVQ